MGALLRGEGGRSCRHDIGTKAPSWHHARLPRTAVERSGCSGCRPLTGPGAPEGSGPPRSTAAHSWECTDARCQTLRYRFSTSCRHDHPWDPSEQAPQQGLWSLLSLEQRATVWHRPPEGAGHELLSRKAQLQSQHVPPSLQDSERPAVLLRWFHGLRRRPSPPGPALICSEDRRDGCVRVGGKGCISGAS